MIPAPLTPTNTDGERSDYQLHYPRSFPPAVGRLPLPTSMAPSHLGGIARRNS